MFLFVACIVEMVNTERRWRGVSGGGGGLS